MSIRALQVLLAAALILPTLACTSRIGGDDEGRGDTGSDDAAGSSRGGGKSGGAGDQSGARSGGDAPEPPVDAEGRPLQFAPARVRRLTAVEVQNSVRDVLLGGAGAAAVAVKFPREVRRHDFDNNAAYLDVSLGFSETMQSFAESAATAAVARLAKLVPCAASPDDEAACASEFLKAIGPRIYRRPLTDAERSRLTAVYTQARGRVGFGEAIGIVIEAMLQSPHFLFRTELGGAASPEGLARLEGYEVASALSYLIWRSAPDQELLDAAEGGMLDSASGRGEHAKRLLADARAKDGLRDFFLQLLEVDQLATGSVVKTDAAFNDALAAAMYEESSRFIDDVLWEGDGTFGSLLQQPTTFANAALASLYGLATRPSGFERVDLDRDRRAGFLTQPGFLAVMTSPSGFNPIFPGLFVRKKLFCQDLPAPPDDIPQVPKDPNLSTRERFAMHSDPGACQGCHKLLDPIGFGLERYDALGRYREQEQAGTRSVALTGEGQLEDTDVDGAFAGPVELAAKLADSAMVRECLSAQLLRFASGRDIALPDNRTSGEDHAIAAVADSDATAITDLLIALTADDVFVTRDASALSGANP